MSASKSSKRKWTHVRSLIPFIGHKKRTNKVTTSESNAVQNESLGDFSENGDKSVTIKDRQTSETGNDGVEKEDVCERHGSHIDGSEAENEIGELGVESKKQISGKENSDKLEDASKCEEGDEAIDEQDEKEDERNAGKRGSITNMTGTLYPLSEKDENRVSSAPGKKVTATGPLQQEEEGKMNSSEVLSKHKSFAEVGKEVQRKIITVNSFASKDRNKRNESTSKASESEIQSEEDKNFPNCDSDTVEGNENRQRRPSSTKQQSRADKTRKERQSKAGPDKQWRNVKNVYTVTIKHGSQSEYEKPVSAEYDEQERRRQAELLFWRLDMEDIMLRLRRINRTLDGHLRRLSENKKPGK